MPGTGPNVRYLIHFAPAAVDWHVIDGMKLKKEDKAFVSNDESSC
jgi:hypothetical protein